MCNHSPGYSTSLVTATLNFFLTVSYQYIYTCSSSRPTVPGNPPRYLRPLSSLGRSIALRWSSPVSDTLLGGPVTGYMIRLASNSSGKTEEHVVPQTISQSGNSITFTVDGLKPVTKYATSVAAVNAFGVGVFTSVVMATTKEAGKLRTVLNEMHYISFYQ